MVFNPDKCKHIRITNKQKVIQTSYNIHGQTLNETSKAKYLGVTIDNTLSWNSHIYTVTKKASQTTTFLRRNLSSCPKDVKAKCYMSTTWICFDGMGPCNKFNIAKVESVQRRVARFCYNDYCRTSSVTSMLQELGSEDLQSRWEQNKVAMIRTAAIHQTLEYLRYGLWQTSISYHKVRELSRTCYCP